MFESQSFYCVCCCVYILGQDTFNLHCFALPRSINGYLLQHVQLGSTGVQISCENLFVLRTSGLKKLLVPHEID